MSLLKFGNRLLGFNGNLLDDADWIKIGRQYWKKKYLDVDDGQGGITETPEGVKLYTIDAATRVAEQFPGWHITTPYDGNELVTYVRNGGAYGDEWNPLTSRTGWPIITYNGVTKNFNGTNSSGFNAKYITGYSVCDIWNFEEETALIQNGFCIWEKCTYESYPMYGLRANWRFDQYGFSRQYDEYYQISQGYRSEMKYIKLPIRLVKDIPSIPVQSDEVQIGYQVWKKEDLAVDDGQGGVYVVNGKYYYTPAAAIRIANTITGYRIPTRAEAIDLIEFCNYYLGPNYDSSFYNLASTTGWTYGNGVNRSGFNGNPNGYYKSSTSSVSDNGIFYGCYLKSSESIDGFMALANDEFSYNAGVQNYPSEYYPGYMQVRLIKDL